jgi:hypothetical protein
LDVAFFAIRGLLDGHHVPLHFGKLGGGLLVATTKKAAARDGAIAAAVGDAIFRALTVLSRDDAALASRLTEPKAPAAGKV